MECKYCESTNIEEISFDEHNSGFFCHDCGKGEVDYIYGKCCNDPELTEVQFEQANGVWVQRTACSNCKSLKGGNKKKSTNFSSLRKYYQAKYVEYMAIHNASRKKIAEYIEGLRIKFIETNKQQWWDGYTKYLSSQIWKDKRQLVLERDKFICQGCLKNKATQVHHTSYANVKDELLFQLVSVCNDCHKKLHTDNQ